MGKQLTHEEFVLREEQHNPNIKIIGQYTKAQDYIKCYCKIHNHTFDIQANALKRLKSCCPIGGNLLRLENDFKKFEKDFYEKFSFYHPNLELLSKFQGGRKPITYKCNVCKQVSVEDCASSMVDKRHHGCPVCVGKRIVKGYNDIATTHPHLIKYFVNPDDAFKYSHGSTKKMQMKCPICGEERLYVLSQLTREGRQFSCKKCGDGFSYPNKFMYCLLSQCRIDFQTEVEFDWLKGRKYDFVISDIIIEMDGLFHIRNVFIDDVKEIDELKTNSAIENNYNLIRIPCYVSNFNLIKEEVIKSGLLELLNIQVDWNKLEYDMCNTNMTKIVSQFYEENKDKLTKQEMVEALKICPTSLIKLLKQGTKCGLCNYDSTKKNNFIHKK